MRHLDEGLLTELLDGELAGPEQREVEAHLRTCAECRDRLAELKGFMQEADQLVTALDEPRAPASQPVHRQRRYRALAWAASIVMAVALGFGARSMLRNRRPAMAIGDKSAVGNLALDTATPSPSSPAPAPSEQVALDAPAATEARTGDTRQAHQGQRESDAEAANDSLSQERKDSAAVVSNQPTNLAARPQEGPAVAAARTNAAAGSGARTEEAVRNVDGVASQPGYRGTGFASTSRDSVAVGDAAKPADELADQAAASKLARKQEPERAQVSPPAAAPAPLQSRSQPSPEMSAFAPAGRLAVRTITMDEAVRLLGGSIRLVDSLTPVRVVLLGADSTVRVVYRTAGVEIWLDQTRSRPGVVFSQSLGLAELQRRDTTSNILSWNDLQGFYLTLTGPLPSSILEQLKARIH
jgi:anti-sigma factor RsiW